MGAIEDIAQHLDTSSTAITRGVNLFAHTLPETTAVAVGLFERTPPGPVQRFGSGTPAIRRHTIQVLARSTMPTNGEALPVPTNARARADVCWTAMNGILNTTINGSTYLRAEPLTEPFEIARDERGRVVFGFSAVVWRHG